MAVRAYSETEDSQFSNIEYFIIQSGLSFDPTFSSPRSGVLQSNYWSYLINNGIPMLVNTQGVSLAMTFNDLLIELDPNNLVKKATFDGQFAGAAFGSFHANTLQDLSSIDGMTLIGDQAMTIDMDMNILGTSLGVDMNLNVHFNTPVEWFLDRTNLDSLPIGYVYDEQGQVSGSLSGRVNISSAFFSDSIAINESVQSVDRWEIIEKHASTIVQGREYFNIVVVKRTTILPSMGVGGDVSNQTVDMIYWVAEGIGMIKGSGQFDFNGQPLTIELIDSNLL